MPLTDNDLKDLIEFDSRSMISRVFLSVLF